MPKYPEIGDQVWFYFMHAFTDVKLQGVLWRATGKFEMRCRPAVVIGDGCPTFKGIYPVLRVEFANDDMNLCLHGGGLAARFPNPVIGGTHIDAMAHIDATGMEPEGRIIGGRWPMHYTWAWDPMPGFEGGRR